MGKKNRKGLVVVEAEAAGVVSDVRDVGLRKNVRHSVDDVHSENGLKTVTEIDPLSLETNSMGSENNPVGLEYDAISPSGLQNNPLGIKPRSVIDSVNMISTVQDTMPTPISTHDMCNSSYTANFQNTQTSTGCREQTCLLGKGDNSQINVNPDLSDDFQESYQIRRHSRSCSPVRRFSNIGNRAMRDPNDIRPHSFGSLHHKNSINQTSLQKGDLTSILEDMKNFLDNVQSNVQSTRGSERADLPRASSTNHEVIPKKRKHIQKRRKIRRAYREDTSSSSSTEELSNAESTEEDSISTTVVTQGRRRKKFSYKLPPFTGQDKEKWVVWRGRFEETADRANWSQSDKLDELLPRMQGGAGEFVFEQLSRDTRSNYKKLIEELDNRYRVVETKKSLEAKFSSRHQKPNEPVEMYAADLKKLYAKAYPGRDESIRREDLLRKFFDGLNDEKVQFQVEYIKEPDNIDDAVFQVVNFCDMNKRNASRAEKKPIRAVNASSTNPGQKKAEGNREDKSHKYANDKQDHELQMIKKQIQNIEEMLKHMNQNSTLPFTQRQQSNTQTNKTCYFCQKPGHFIRDCPVRMQQNDNAAHDAQKILQNNTAARQSGNLNSQGS